MPITSVGMLLHGIDQMPLRRNFPWAGNFPWIGNWQFNQQNIHCLKWQGYPHSKPSMELGALVTFWEVMFPWLSLTFIDVTDNKLTFLGFLLLLLLDMREVMKEKWFIQSLCAGVWAYGFKKPQEYRKLQWEEKLHWRFCQPQKQWV